MTQNAAVELREGEVGQDYFENAVLSGTVAPIASVLFGPRRGNRRIQRSEARTELTALIWVTSLHKPGVFEVIPTENVSRLGLRMVTQKSWEPGELVLVSSPPGLCVQGSVVYCKKLPSDDYTMGIRLDAPVEHWIETLGPGALLQELRRNAA